MDREVIDKGLEPTASTQERVFALGEIGLTQADIAYAVEAQPVTVARWSQERFAGKDAWKGAEKLDDLRCVMGKLMLKGMEPERACRLMHSRMEAPPHERPLDLIKNGQPQKVFKLIDSIPDEQLQD
jgi:hypothetical protein